MKFCKSCKHGDAVNGRCYSPKAVNLNLVTGDSEPGDAYLLRADVEKCGPDGEWFEKAEPIARQPTKPSRVGNWQQ